MLKKFEVQNFRGFNKSLVFDFQSSNYDFNNHLIRNNLVNTAIIYGKNGSGKTNLGFAILDIVAHLTDTHISRSASPFYLNASNALKEAKFIYDFEFENFTVKYEYTKNNNQKILSEILTINSKILISHKRGESIITHLSGTESLLKTIPDDLNLSALKYIEKNSRLNENSKYARFFKKFMNFVSKMLLFRNVFDAVQYIGLINESINIEEHIIESNKLADFQNFLNQSDINYELIEENTNGKKSIGIVFGERILPFWTVSSTGTKNLLIFYFWWISLQKNEVSFVFIDEFDSAYHYSISEAIVKRLSKLENTQVVLTTHNVTLLNNDLIRPDCAFILENGSIKSLPNLTEKELRQGHNLEKLFKAKAFSNE